jgi:hypothetical protein
MVAPAPVRFPEPEPEPEHAPPPPPEPLPVLARPSPFARAPEPEPARAPIDNFPKVPPTRPTVIFPDRSERTLPVMLIVGLIAAMLAAGGIVYSILHFRGAIMSAMPVTAHAYCAVGVTFPDNGLKVNDVKAERTFADGMPYLEVRGQVVNTGKATASVPRVRAALKDKSGKELYSWNISATASQLVPGQSADFSSRLPSPDTQSAILTVQLANPCSKS